MAFEYPTNYSGGQEVTGPGSFFLDWPTQIIANYANGILLLIWLAVFAVSMAFGSRKAILTSSFITGIFAVFFAARDWVNPVIPIALIIMVIIGFFGSTDSSGGL